MRTIGWAAAALWMVLTGSASAQGNASPPVVGEPHPWQLWHQAPVTPVMEMMDSLHLLLLWIMVAIVLLVMVLLGFVIMRFNARRNPVPSRTSHNTVIEVIWTVAPVIILVVIAVPSFRLLYFLDRTEHAELTLKVTGRQWYWDYEYPDQGGFTFSSIMIPDAEIKPGQRRLLEVDNRVVLPVDTNIRVLITAGDVIHAWAVPAFGLKDDAVPGRVNETWMRIEKEGVYYGQCSEICGTNHGFMPIAVEAVSKEAFARWTEQARTKFAARDAAPTQDVASAAR
ncbi:MAG TPA: cytochrome c oxidase subunit II [Azospirillum sp.]|nr:cytochrome c oxidase subunit II [Azospirillum sp.]